VHPSSDVEIDGGTPPKDSLPRNKSLFNAALRHEDYDAFERNRVKLIGRFGRRRTQKFRFDFIHLTSWRPHRITLS
jgi:hypothetical protein